MEQEGSSQAKLLLDRFVARAAELKIPVRRKIELIFFLSDFTLSCTFVGVLTAAFLRVLLNYIVKSFSFLIISLVFNLSWDAEPLSV